MVRLVAEDWTASRIARHFHKDRTTVYPVLRRFLDQGLQGLAYRKPPGAPRKFTPEMAVFVEERLAATFPPGKHLAESGYSPTLPPTYAWGRRGEAKGVPRACDCGGRQAPSSGGRPPSGERPRGFPLREPGLVPSRTQGGFGKRHPRSGLVNQSAH